MKRTGAVISVASAFLMAVPILCFGKAEQIRTPDGTIITVELPDVAPDKAQAAVDRAHSKDKGGGPAGQDVVSALLVSDLEAVTVSGIQNANPASYVCFYTLNRDGGVNLGLSYFSRTTGKFEYVDGNAARGRGEPLQIVVSNEFLYQPSGTVTLQYDGGRTLTIKFPQYWKGRQFFVASDGSLYLDPELTQKA